MKNNKCLETIKKELTNYITEEYAFNNKVVLWDSAETATGLKAVDVDAVVDEIVDSMNKHLSDYLEEDEIDVEQLVNDYQDNFDVKIFNPLVTKTDFSGYDGDPEEVLAECGYYSIRNIEKFVHSLYFYLKDSALPLTEERFTIYIDKLLESCQAEGTNAYEIDSHLTNSGNPVTIYFDHKSIPIVDDHIVGEDQADDAEAWFTQIEF